MLKNALVFVLLAGLAGSASAAKKTKASSSASLGAGQYTAQVAMLACGACGSNVEQTLQKLPGVENAKVDSNKSTVTFAVKKGAKIAVSDLQKALKASADQMGMGADYTLSKIKALEADKTAPAAAPQKS